MKKYDYVIFIGRFQPPHLSHIEIIKQGLEKADKVIVLTGSANQPRTIKNPWTWRERAEMIQACLSSEETDKVTFHPLRDKLYNDQLWAKQVQAIVDKIVKAKGLKNVQQSNKLTRADTSPKIGIIGHSKDETSYYLNMFPQWTLIDVDTINDMHATDIRRAYFSMGENNNFEKSIANNLPKSVHSYLQAFALREEYEQLVKEYDCIEKYKQAWSTAPYPPTFVTVDAVVVQSGHILLIKRRAEPGKNLWALPGGFINQNERLTTAAIRELREETKLKVPEPVLRGNIKRCKVYDHPRRSLRGRTITHAYLIELPSGPLPKVKGSDDANKAKWIPFSTLEKMEDQLFEDHYSIITDIIGSLN